MVAAVLYLKDVTDSAVLLGLFQFLALIPGFILSPLSGSLIDRWSRRNVLIVTDALRGVLMIGAGLFLLIGLGSAPTVLLTLSFAAGLGHAFFVPAAQALIPEIVPPTHLSTANALRTGGSQIFNMTGNAVGGVLFVVLGAPIVLILNGVTFLISAVQEAWIAPPPLRRDRKHPPLNAASLRGDVATVLRYLKTRPVIRTRIVAQAGMFLLSPVFLLTLPFVLIDELGTGEQVLGYIFAASLAGGIVVFVALSRLSTERLVATAGCRVGVYACSGLCVPPSRWNDRFPCWRAALFWPGGLRRRCTFRQRCAFSTPLRRSCTVVCLRSWKRSPPEWLRLPILPQGPRSTRSV